MNLINMSINPPAGYAAAINDTICAIPIPCDQVENLHNFASNVWILCIELFIVGVLVGLIMADPGPVVAWIRGDKK